MIRIFCGILFAQSSAESFHGFHVSAYSFHGFHIAHCNFCFLVVWTVDAMRMKQMNQGRIGSMVFTSALWHVVLHCLVRFHG